MGKYEELMERKGLFYELAYGSGEKRVNSMPQEEVAASWTKIWTFFAGCPHFPVFPSSDLNSMPI